MRDMISIHDVLIICVNCYENGDYFCCSGCSESYHCDDGRSDDYDTYCESCWEDRSPISGYDYEPPLFFYHTVAEQGPRLLFFGVETEIEVDERRFSEPNAAEDFLHSDRHDFFYCMSDGTINHGFEVATHPFTWEWAKEHRDWWAPLFAMRNVGTSYANSTCGMHVHMSRKAFSKMHLLKFSNMLFDNPGFVLRISRRHADRLEKYACVQAPTDLFNLVKGGVSGSHHAINFSFKGTIECRIFQGTLNPRGYWANLEFLVALYNYTKEASFQDVTPANFTGWAKERAKEYPLLLDVLFSRVPSVSQR